MVEYFNDLAANSFLRYSLIAGLIASVSFGVVGTYVVARRITYIAGAVAHCALGGIGVALYAQKVLGWEWCDPIYGALAVSVSAALVIGWVTLRGSEREDTIIGALWATGMAIGFLFIQKIPGTVSTTTWLFGDINIVSSTIGDRQPTRSRVLPDHVNCHHPVHDVHHLWPGHQLQRGDGHRADDHPDCGGCVFRIAIAPTPCHEVG